MEAEPFWIRAASIYLQYEEILQPEYQEDSI